MDRKQSGRGPNNAPDGPRREGAGTPDDRASAADRHGGRDFRTRDWLFAAALVVAVFVAYQPAWQGGFIWDDDAHLLNNPVLEPGGLFRMWVPGTHINYWPLTWTAYRIQYQLWGLAPVGFHLVNIALHALSAILIWRILALMRVPGAGFAAALFALHPVNVESVAWISQLKNTLSLALTLLSVLLYLLSESRSRLPGGTLGGATDPAAPSPARQAGPTQAGPTSERGDRWWFVGAVVAFGLATLAKGMTLTLPVVLLACVWWQRGRIQRRDLWRVVPFLLIGLMMAGVELWQQHLAAGQTIVRSDGLLSRTAVAGCAVWFYIWKLIWPAKLIFVYPRWNLNHLNALWFLPGLLLAAMFALAWRWRYSWGRPVLMLIVCYLALLLPVLGFVNIYFMEYSLVADHWQYAAMIAPCAAFAGFAAATVGRRRWSRLPGVVLSLALLATLATLTWRQSRLYADIETLYRTTIDRNPDCCMARNNLGLVLAGRGRIDEAIEQYQQALKTNPDYAEAHVNIGTALAGRGRIDDAMAHYRRALDIRPNYAEAHNNLGAALAFRGHIDEAMASYQRALQIDPNHVLARNNLGFALAGRGRIDEAIEQYRNALNTKPDCVEAHYNLANALAARNRLDEAVSHYQQALAVRPDMAEAHYHLALALARGGRADEAMTQLRKTLEIKPDYAEAHFTLGTALAGRGRIDEAMAHFREALKINPDNAQAQYNFGFVLAGRGRIDEAIAHFQEALRIKPDYAEAHFNLGTALANRRRVDEAIDHYRKGLVFARQQNNPALAEALQARLRATEAEAPRPQPQQPSRH